MIQILLALIGSLGTSLGGKTGELVQQLVGTIGAVNLGVSELEQFATPWITWANKIVDEKRDPTDEEHAAARALADAVHANNQSLANGGSGSLLPAPPGA